MVCKGLTSNVGSHVPLNIFEIFLTHIPLHYHFIKSVTSSQFGFLQKLHEFGKAYSFNLHEIVECMASKMHRSSMNMMKYLAPLREGVFVDPQMSLCTRPKISLALIAPSFGMTPCAISLTHNLARMAILLLLPKTNHQQNSFVQGVLNHLLLDDQTVNATNSSVRFFFCEVGNLNGLHYCFA
jgi:hypothetical protein